MVIYKAKNYQDMSRKAANIISAQVIMKPHCVLGLATGSSPIGTYKGLVTRDLLAIIIEQSNVPVIVDAGLGAPSHAAAAMEMGADAVLVNTAIAVAGDPVRMARAFAQAVVAGREAYEAGLGAQAQCAEASSPLTAFLD